MLESPSPSPIQPTLLSPREDPSPESTTTSTINLSRIYNNALHAASYKEMHRITSSIDLVAADEDHVLAQVLRPGRDHVHNALHRSKSSTLNTLISSYFTYSEKITTLCLTIRRSVAEARRLYSPIHKLLDDLPLDDSPLSLSQCDHVFQEFCKFDEGPNPFPGPNLHTFDVIRDLLSDLKPQLDRRLRKSSSRIRLVRPPADEPNTICCVGGGAAITAYIPPKFARRELAYAAQLKVASRHTFVLKTDLDALDSLVVRLHNTVDYDKRSIRVGLDLGNDNTTVEEVLKLLGRSQQNLGDSLDLLEQKITTCLTTINRSRSQLLHEILLHQNSAESSHSKCSHT